MSTSSQPEQPIPPALQTLRDRIDQIDHQFMDLLAERHRVVGEVAAVKRETGIPIRDDGREAALLADRRSVADRSGLNPEVTESLFRLVLWASRNRQAQLHAAVPQDLTSQRVAVIGAEGGMGTMMSGLLQDLGNEVLTVDRNTTLKIGRAHV